MDCRLYCNKRRFLHQCFLWCCWYFGIYLVDHAFLFCPFLRCCTRFFYCYFFSIHLYVLPLLDGNVRGNFSIQSGKAVEIEGYPKLSKVVGCKSGIKLIQGLFLILNHIWPAVLRSLQGLFISPFLDFFMVSTHEFCWNFPSPEILRSCVNGRSK